MRISRAIPIVAAMALPRAAISYGFYAAAPLFMINWLSSRSYAKALLFLSFLALSALVNSALGLTFSFTAWALELALFLPMMAAVLGFAPARYLDGRSFIRMLNIVVFLTSMFSLVQKGFPFQLPYIHYLPDFFNGLFGNGGAKIVTVIGFFGVAEGISRKRAMTVRDNFSLVLSALNFLVPNFILGMLAGFVAFVIFAKRNKALLFAGAAVAMVVVPYLQFRAETKNNVFAEYAGVNPKIYSFLIVGQLYAGEPHTALVGSGIGQFSSQPAIWISPISDYLGSHQLPDLPGMFPSDAHNRYLAPKLLRFKDQIFAIDSSANKPYSGITQMLAELGLPVTVLILYSAHLCFWRRSFGEFGKAVFVYFLSINLLDPQIDSPWFGVMMLASLQIVRRDAQIAIGNLSNDANRETGVYLRPVGGEGQQDPQPVP